MIINRRHTALWSLIRWSIRGDLNPPYVLPNHRDDEVHSLSHPDAWNSSAIQRELALFAGEIKGAAPATEFIVPYISFRFSSTHQFHRVN